MYKTVVAAAGILPTGAGVCLAQPPGMTRETIARALPLEGAPPGETGPYKLRSEGPCGAPGHLVFRPTALEAFPNPASGAPASPMRGPDALAKLGGPVLLINGGEPDFMMAQSAATFDLVENLRAFYGSRHNAVHTATEFLPGGGEFANPNRDVNPKGINQ